MKSESPKGFHNPIGTFRRKVDYNHGARAGHSEGVHGKGACVYGQGGSGRDSK